MSNGFHAVKVFLQNVSICQKLSKESPSKRIRNHCNCAYTVLVVHFCMSFFAAFESPRMQEGDLADVALPGARPEINDSFQERLRPHFTMDHNAVFIHLYFCFFFVDIF